MTTAVQLWSLPLPAGQKVKFSALRDVQLTNAALDAEIADENARSAVKLTYEKTMVPMEDLEEEDEDDVKIEKATTVLFALTPGKIEQAALNLVLIEGDEYVFENVGKNLVHLTGNYIDQPEDEPPEFDSDSDEEGYALHEVSSDVEINPDELMDEDSDDSHRFEEVKDDEESKSKKRPRESDAMEGEKKLSKKEKKALKKQKSENGMAVPTLQANGDEKAPQEKEEKKEKKEKKAEKSNDTKELPSGLQMKDVKIGSGKVAKKGDMISMRYIGKFTDGKVFDKNTSGKPFTFKLGAGEVIKGWDEGIAGMQPGGERLLIVPPKLGYGNRKIDGIPAGSTLRFECKLIDLK